MDKKEKYKEVIKNAFEIFKLINRNTGVENNGVGHSNIQSPLIEDENFQILLIFITNNAF